jgi:GNAT superfamily N-acetyltransferase
VSQPATSGEVTLRDMGPRDVASGLRLCRLAQWNQKAEDWQALLANGAFRVATRGEQCVASGGAVRYEQRLAWIAMILVDPAERGRGLATRLVADQLQRLQGFGSVGLDATPQGVAVYTRHGFTDRSGFARMERPADAPAVRSVVDPAVLPLTVADLDAMAPFDRAVFGADRSAALRWAQAQAPEYAVRLDADASGDASSYLFGRHGHRTEHLGPLVAPHEGAASALLAAVLAAHPGKAFSLDAPERPAWIERLGRLGFKLQRPFRRMILGNGELPGDPEQVLALFGPEFG